MKKISLSPEALAALNAESDEPIKVPPKPLPLKAQNIISMGVREAMFGPTMKPSLRSRLLMWTSHAAIKASWAADHWQKMQTAKKIKDALLA